MVAAVIAAVIWIRVRRLVGEEVDVLPVAGGGGGGRSGGGEGGRRGGARAEDVDGDGAEACAEGVLHLRKRAEGQHACDVGMPRVGTGNIIALKRCGEGSDTNGADCADTKDSVISE